MGRVWAVIGAFVAVATVGLVLESFLGMGTLLTMGVPIGAGLVAAYLPGDRYVGRAGWLVVGTLLGAVGFALGAMMFPDTKVGLWLGAIVPVLLLGLLVMWTRSQSHALAGILGSGALAGVYAHVFDADPQSLNVSLPIALGQTLLPLGLAYMAGILVVAFVAGDEAVAAGAGSTSDDGSPESAEPDLVPDADAGDAAPAATGGAPLDATMQQEVVR
jgi:hypothetical protein